MNTEFFKNYLNLKEDTKRAYESYIERIQRSFAFLK
jgi:ketopantoate hydroxymethyltransferase